MVTKIKSSVIILSLVIIFLIIALVCNPETYIQSTYTGIIVWATAVLPALFPFFFLTKLLTNLGLVEKISKFGQPITKFLFNCSGISSYVFLMSIISGYPVGAKLTAELYQNKIISQSEAVRMCSFCSTSGPLFIIGTVGVEMFLCRGAGLIILIAHILSAIINGIIFRFYNKNEQLLNINYQKEKNVSNILSETIYDSVISILIVGGYIALFFMIIDVLSNFYILTIIKTFFANILNFSNINSEFSTGISSGIVEVTRGCLELSQYQDLFWSVIFATGLISWGGLSILFQSLTFLKTCKIKIGFYILQKLSQCFISMLLCYFILKLFPL